MDITVHQDISKNPGPTGFHGLLHRSIDSTSIIVQQSTTDLMDIFINDDRNISSTRTKQEPDLLKHIPIFKDFTLFIIQPQTRRI